MTRILHPHQKDAMAMLRQSLSTGHRRPVLQAPTGFGKTVLAGEVVECALRKGKRIIVTVPALSLIDQTVESFWAQGIREIGVLQGDHPLTNILQPVQVASAQTLARRKIPMADIVLIDECHKWFDSYGKWMHDPAWAGVPFIGLSATPWTKGLGKHFDDLLIAATTKDLIDLGFLSDFKVYAPPSGLRPDLRKVKTVAGDFQVDELSDEMQKPQLVADAVTTWLDKGENRPTLCFAVDRAHARALQEQFQAAGVPTEYVDAFTTRAEREEIRRKFHAGEVKVVCNVGCLTTGVDWDVRCISLCRPTKSEMLYTQIIGRGLRMAEGKTDCLILDHSDTTLNLGFVTDIHHDHLDDGKHSISKSRKRKDEQPKPKECPKCHVIKPLGVHVCPSCGFEPKRQSDVKHEHGELTLLKGGKPKADRETKQRWYSMLYAVALDKGYKPGWVANQYRAKFDVWPRDLIEAPIPPDPEVINWVKSRMIAYAKRRAA